MKHIFLCEAEATVFTISLSSPPSGCQISVASSSTFSGEKALVVEGRTAKWAGPEAGNPDFVQF